MDSSFILVERCVFANASSAAIRMIPATGLYPSPHWNGSKDSYHGSASTQVTVRTSEFFHNEQVLINWCDGFAFLDNWVGGCYEKTCSRGKALFENHDTLFIERMLGVPSPRAGFDQRWIDNVDGMVIARDSRFGGEGGGFTVVNNQASFLRVPNHRIPGGPGGSGHFAPPPPRGPLPPGTGWVLDPQNAAVIISGCQIDSLGNKERNANIYLEQLPAILVVERSQGFAYAPRWQANNFSFLKIDPQLDLDGPQLDFAGQHPHMIRIDIDSEGDNTQPLLPFPPHT
jgi:hypothetical protein